MKVLVLGPVQNKEVSGGVAVFDECICKGFLSLGDESNIVSIQKSDNIDNFVVKSKNRNPFFIIFKFGKIAKIIKKYQPDLVISSLHYSLGIKKYKRKWPKAKYVQVLHGTPCPINGRFKSWCVNYVARFSKKYFDKLVTVSHLSWAINKKINRVECDAIISNGSDLICDKIDSKKQYDFCYIGRLYRDKNIEILMDSLIELHKFDETLRVCIAGFGEQEYLFKTGSKYDLDFVDFKGKVDHNDVPKIYSKSKFFISLCELEACGLSFFEAASCGCNPVASLSSGQSAFFRGKKYYHTVDASSVSSLTNELKEVIRSYIEITPDDIKEIREKYCYKSIASQYKSLFFK